MSCITELTEKLKEQGTGVLKFFCRDDDSNIVVPTTIGWQLSDEIGNVINNQDFSSNDISGTQETITIGSETGLGFVVVLKGDDLKLLSYSDKGERRFAIAATYNSSAGTDLPLHAEYIINICDLINFS